MPLPATAVFVPPTVRTLYVSADEARTDTNERAIFYDDRTGTAVATIDEGTVTWSVVDAAFGPDGPVRRVIRAEADIPNRDMRMVMTIYRNDDPRLPNDAIVELAIDMPRNFDDIEWISRFELNDGEPIVGSENTMKPASGDGFFQIALALDQSSARITNQLKNAQWIDITMVYKSGRRALFTLKSDLPGDEAFAQLLDSWEQPVDHVDMLPAQ
jgi:hypothetical protein